MAGRGRDELIGEFGVDLTLRSVASVTPHSERDHPGQNHRRVDLPEDRLQHHEGAGHGVHGRQIAEAYRGQRNHREVEVPSVRRGGTASVAAP